MNLKENALKFLNMQEWILPAHFSPALQVKFQYNAVILNSMQALEIEYAV